MEQQQPPEPDREATGSLGAGYDALRRLEARLDRASEAAERLFAEATARGAAASASQREASRAAAGASQGEANGAAAGASQDAAGAEPRPESATDPPPAGWQTPGADSSDSRRDVDLLLNLAHSVRELIPPELQRRLAEALRELLLALRALIDWYLERVERRRSEPAEVQDIPIQ